jgi:hypothetical protein
LLAMKRKGPASNGSPNIYSCDPSIAQMRHEIGRDQSEATDHMPRLTGVLTVTHIEQKATSCEESSYHWYAILGSVCEHKER